MAKGYRTAKNVCGSGLDGCDGSNTPATMKDVAACYLKYWPPIRLIEFVDYKKLRSLNEVIEKAALAYRCPLHSIEDSYSKHPHQHRRTDDALDAAAEALVIDSQSIMDCKSFAELYTLIDGHYREITDLGPLSTYDTAVRIGYYLGLRPKEVYLHADVAKGAKAYLSKRGVKPKSVILPRSEFPDFSQLSADYIENLLCVCKECIEGAKL